MTFFTTVKQSSDKISNYIYLFLNKDETDRLQSDGGVIDFLLVKRHSFPKLHHIALRILITFASSPCSQRGFSAFKLAVQPGNSHVKPDIINGKLKVQRAASFNSDILNVRYSFSATYNREQQNIFFLIICLLLDSTQFMSLLAGANIRGSTMTILKQYNSHSVCTYQFVNPLVFSRIAVALFIWSVSPICSVHRERSLRLHCQMNERVSFRKAFLAIFRFNTAHRYSHIILKQIYQAAVVAE